MAAHQISSSHAPNQCSFHGNRISGCLAAARSVPTKWQINNVDSITLPQRCLSLLPVRALVWISCASARQDMSAADQDRATQPKKKMLSGGVGWKLNKSVDSYFTLARRTHSGSVGRNTSLFLQLAGWKQKTQRWEKISLVMYHNASV